MVGVERAVSHSNYLSSFAQLAATESAEERLSLWRQGVTTLARAALDQQPVPLEGMDPQLLLQAVQVAQRSGLLDDLTWLSPAGAAAAVYELASAIPDGPDRRRLGRDVLTHLHRGNAETFIVLATSLAAESKRTLTGAPIRARIALSLSLPIGSTTADALALTLLSRADMRREWLSDPACGALPSRRLSARLLERAAREAARRAAQGDAGSLRVFHETTVRATWDTLLADRESLVWRHVATARGLLVAAMPELGEEIEDHLRSRWTPTEWRRAAVSLAASITVNPRAASRRCRDLLRSELPSLDPGLASTLIYGLGQAAESEPESTEDLLNQIVRIGGLDAAEALVELRRERLQSAVGEAASRYCRDRLKATLAAGSIVDDGKAALCEALRHELSAPTDREPTLREHLDAALLAFVEQDAHSAFKLAQDTFQLALQTVGQLEQAHDGSAPLRRLGLRALRELDTALLETAALGDLLVIGGSRARSRAATAPLGDIFERLTNWLLRTESRPFNRDADAAHPLLRLRRMRALLHLVDADGGYGHDVTERRPQRRKRTLRMLLKRARHDGSSALSRTVCAAVARCCDAMLRDDLCELSDVLVTVADHVRSEQGLRTIAEASMMPDLERCVAAYGQLAALPSEPRPNGRTARQAVDRLSDLAQGLPWASTLRVSAMRRALIELSTNLETLAGSRSLPALMEGQGQIALRGLEAAVYQVALLTAGARRRLSTDQPPVPASGSAISALEMTLEQRIKGQSDHVDEMLKSVQRTFDKELSPAIALALQCVVQRMAHLSLTPPGGPLDSFTPPAKKESPLPPWLPARRTLGGFYVLRALGNGGVGSVFVVVRAEERHNQHADRFALKVPDYNADAARTLSEEEFLQLFRQEAGALLAVPRHENLAGFVTFDAGAHPKPILVMELVEGPTMEWALERHDLTMHDALAMIDGIGAGLHSMHAAGIGHLDIKPSNVILRQGSGPQADAPVPVLVDFGLSGRQIRPGCATVSYGAPEIWGLIPDQHRPEPMAADAYAYACLTFEALTGETLFDGPGELAIINAHLVHDGYPAKLLQMRETQPHLDTLCDLIANGLRQHPGKRITVQQLRSGLLELGRELKAQSWPLQVP